ncbi:MAG: histidine phosphatase family protein [Oscillospiraceae bacterium]|nr:histidine phosphatase family protein [Oscillospiraceae bacterium]
MSEIYIIRHAEAEGNLYRRIHGHYDSLVTERGLRQIADLGRRFEGKRFDAIYSSDLFRTQKTASVLAELHNLKIQTTPDLREINMGAWEDLPFGEIERESPQLLHAFNNDPWNWATDGSEAFDDVAERVARAVVAIADDAENRIGSNAVIAIFTHGVALRSFVSGLHGITTTEGLKTIPHSDNTSVTRLTFGGGAVRLDYYGDNSHLAAENSTLAKQKWWRARASEGGNSDFNIRFVPDGDERVDALLGERRVGFLTLDMSEGAECGVGTLAHFELDETHRGVGMGVQLIGQAVSTFRRLGRGTLETLPTDEPSRGFLAYHGFKPQTDSVKLALNIKVSL